MATDKVAHMKPGDGVIWVRSPGRSFLTGWKVAHVPAVVTRVCRRRIMIRVRLGGRDKVLMVNPENVVCREDL